MTVRLKLHLILTAAALALLPLFGIAPSHAFDLSGPSFADIAGNVRESVVRVAAAVVDKQRVSARRKRGEPGDGYTDGDYGLDHPKRKPGEPPLQFTSIGSGFVIDPSGLIVTNNHVIEGGNTIYVIFSDGVELKVDKILGRDPKTDLTLLKVTPAGSKPLKAVSFGDSSQIRVGDWVLAIGNPFDLDGTVTAGILSGRGRDINAGPYDDFLQTDAAINRGNSGGPLFNAAGEVIGINTAIFSPSGGSIGLGFAIPSNTARRIVDQLRRYGEARWGWIGVRVQTMSDDVAASLHLPKAEGAVVARVDKGSPAEQAGLVPGDLILSYGGAEVKHARQLPKLVAESAVGEDAGVVVLRGAERVSLKVKVGRLDSASDARPATVPQARARRQKFGNLRFVPPLPRAIEPVCLHPNRE